MNLGERIIKEGTFLYDGSVECDIRIAFSATRFGSGDSRDSDEISKDQDVGAYYIHFGSTTEPDGSSTWAAQRFQQIAARDVRRRTRVSNGVGGIGETVRLAQMSERKSSCPTTRFQRSLESDSFTAICGVEYLGHDFTVH